MVLEPCEDSRASRGRLRPRNLAPRRAWIDRASPILAVAIRTTVRASSCRRESAASISPISRCKRMVRSTAAELSSIEVTGRGPVFFAFPFFFLVGSSPGNRVDSLDGRIIKDRRFFAAFLDSPCRPSITAKRSQFSQSTRLNLRSSDGHAEARAPCRLSGPSPPRSKSLALRTQRHPCRYKMRRTKELKGRNP